MNISFEAVLLGYLENPNDNQSVIDGTILRVALEKRDKIIARYGNGEGERLQPHYLQHLMNEAIYQRAMMNFFQRGEI